MFSDFTYHKAINLKIPCLFCKIHCNFVIICWPESENHWPWASDHSIYCFYLPVYSVLDTVLL